jgi:hypothetical protein
MLDKLLYEEEVKRCCACFEQQFHYGVFYAYMKLREQEIRNIMWVSECVAQVRLCVVFGMVCLVTVCRDASGGGGGVHHLSQQVRGAGEAVECWVQFAGMWGACIIWVSECVAQVRPPSVVWCAWLQCAGCQGGREWGWGEGRVSCG